MLHGMLIYNQKKRAIVKVEMEEDVTLLNNFHCLNRPYLYYRGHPSNQGYIQSHTNHWNYYILNRCLCISPNSFAQRIQKDKLDFEKKQSYCVYLNVLLLYTFKKSSIVSLSISLILYQCKRPYACLCCKLSGYKLTYVFYINPPYNQHYILWNMSQ